MRTIVLSGELGVKFGKTHKMDVRTLGEAIRALCANFPEFATELNHAHERNVGYKVFNGDYQLSEVKEVSEPAAKVIRIVPVIMGANATARILIGAALIATGYAITVASNGALAPVGKMFTAAGFAMALGGVVELLSPIPKIKGPEERPENKPSYLFNGPVNTTAQGHPVPIGYGRLRTGGAIVSAGVSIDQIMAGFKKVQYERVVTRRSEGWETNFNAPPPANWFRKELVAHGFTPGSSTERTEYWDWKFYYYEIILEPVE